MDSAWYLEIDRSTAGRLLIIGGGGNLGVKYLQPALRLFRLWARTDCLEIRPARAGEVAAPEMEAA